MTQVRTFQCRLPKGDHDEVLEAFGVLAGEVIRDLHGWMRAAAMEAECLPLEERRAFLRDAENVIKSLTLARHGISARQYNGLYAQLSGLWESRRELSKLDAERLDVKISKKRAALAKARTKIKKDAACRAQLAAKAAEALKRGKAPPQPTKSQAKAILSDVERANLRFALHQGARKLASLEHDLQLARDGAKPDALPKIVFGSRGLLRERASIHPNDLQSLAAWRSRWDARRSAGFMLIGGSDEAAGNKSCKMSLSSEGHVRLDLRLPDGLGRGKHLCIENIPLASFGRDILEAAIFRNQKSSGRIALTYRFVRDPEFRSDTLSQWRICVTIKNETPEPVPAQNVLGVDVNADHLAASLIDASGNPLQSWTIPLPVRGKTAGQRAAIIGEAAAQIVGIAREHDASIALEALDFKKKKQELEKGNARSRSGQARYARMLSSLAYAHIGGAITRRAERCGVSVRRVNPAYTSLIGEVNFSRRYGLTRHQAAAVAIARRAAGHSERINYIHGYRGRRGTLPAPGEARRHVWRHWAMVHRERSATAASARRESPAHPLGRGASPGHSGSGLSGSARP